MQGVTIQIAFAGKRQHPNLAKAEIELQKLFSRLENYTANHGAALTITMLTGLADGADIDAADALLKWKHADTTSVSLVGVMPFAKEDYLKTIDDKENFERLYKLCNAIVTLDGRYAEDGEATASLRPHECRSRAFRQQAGYLVANSEMLIAVTGPTEPIKPGGTLETVSRAVAKHLPVVFISLDDLQTYYVGHAGWLQDFIEGNEQTLDANEKKFEQALDNIFCF